MTTALLAWAEVSGCHGRTHELAGATQDARTATPPQAAGPIEPAGPRRILVEAPGQAPDCLRQARALAEPFAECVRDPANRDCGIRFVFTRECKAIGVLPWGKVDEAIRACLVSKAAVEERPKVSGSVWFVDYPLGDPAFINPVDGIGERNWLRRGLPRAKSEMEGVPAIRIGSKSPVERMDVTATFGAHRYRLRTVGGALEEPYEPGVLALESEGRTQVLLRDISNVRIRWAGDVDRDGLLDILVQSTVTSFAQRFDLFLSSGADGRLVRLAALDADIGD